MDSARDIATDEIIEAEALWEIASVDKERYRCVGCGTQVWPASYLRGINKKRPYFTLGVASEHFALCNIDGEEKFVKRAATQRIGSVEGFPLPFPNRLVLNDERPVVNRTGDVMHDGVDGRVRTRGDSTRGQRKNHGHTVKTIRPIAKTFMKFPHDRAFLQLQIQDCEGDTYLTVFWRLRELTQFHHPTHLYCAPLHWKQSTKTDTSIEWQLDAGDWDKVNNRRGTPYRVRVDWDQWSTTQRNTLLHEIEVAIDKAKGSNGAVKAWLFFVGKQDNQDQTLLVVNRYQLICCLEGSKSI